MATDHQIEQEIQAKGLTAPRVTEKNVNESITGIDYHILGARTTICCITLRNGFTIIGKSACASPENFDQEIGRAIAYADARNQIWEFLGFQLMTDLMRIHQSIGG